MDRLRFFVVATVLAAIFIAPAALAQKPVNISIISGNGQITCPECTLQGYGRQNFDPLTVRVTGANGNPVANTTVNWSVVTGVGVIYAVGGNFTTAGASFQSVTDVNGNASAQYTGISVNSALATQPALFSTVTASLANNTNAAATFYLSIALANTGSNGNSASAVTVFNLTPANNLCTTCINPGDTLTGNAGSTSAVQFQVQVSAPSFGTLGGGVFSGQIPNVSLRLVSNQGSPTISCATGPGADPGSVLTDQTGTATCTAILGSTPGFGSFYALVGGVDPNISGPEPAFYSTGNYSLHVLPGVAGSVSVTSGNNQGASPGQALSSALVATVGDVSGNPLSGQAVVWTVSPAGAATLFNTSATSDANGHVQTSVALSGSASGPVRITAALASNASLAATFTETANIVVSGLNIVSGNSQTAVVNATFALPLVVQLSTSNGASNANIGVSFSISGPGILSASGATTNSAGQAQVTVIAGSSAGAVTVTASAGSSSTTFSLTVIPAGPAINSGSFYNGADLQQGSISPCSIATIIGQGLAPAIQGAAAPYSPFGGSLQLAGDTVTFPGGGQSPIYNVANVSGQQQLTFQVPCSVTPGSNTVTVNVNGGSASVNLTVLPASPGLFKTQVSSTTSIPVLERPDGSFVSAANPARQGETLIAYVTGLGPTTPTVSTNSLPIPGSTAAVQGIVIVGINGNGATLISATLTPNTAGVYEVAFQVPSTVPSGSNAGFSIGLVPQGSNTPYYSTLGIFPVK